MGTVPIEKPVGLIGIPVPRILDVPLPYGAEVVATVPFTVKRKVLEDKIDPGAVSLREVYVTTLEGINELARALWRVIEVPLV